MCVCVVGRKGDAHTHAHTHIHSYAGSVKTVRCFSSSSTHNQPQCAGGGGLFVLFFFVFCFFFLHCGPNQRFDVPSRFREGVTLDKTTRNGKVSKKSKTNGRERDVGEGGTDTHLYSYLCCVNVCLCVNVCTCV